MKNDLPQRQAVVLEIGHVTIRFDDHVCPSRDVVNRREKKKTRARGRTVSWSAVYTISYARGNPDTIVSSREKLRAQNATYKLQRLLFLFDVNILEE